MNKEELKEYTENNKLISNFMGNLITVDDGNHCFCYSIPNDLGYDELLFSTSFDWLMPVIEKIEEMTNEHNVLYNVLLGRHTLLINTQSDPELIIVNYDVNKITAAWLTVIDFIKWYNESRGNN